MQKGPLNSRGFTVIGLMSGTSLDGLDIAVCRFIKKGKGWKFDILSATTIKYKKSLAEKLALAHKLQAEEFWKLHVYFGRFCGDEVKKFVLKNKIRADFIASHGHTVFHQPDKGFTCQIGDGSQIAVRSGITTICDFRSTDVAKGGQGAPLVPIGDKFLFSAFDACLNIGGIANISFTRNNNTSAFDICAANILFNHFASITGRTFDKDGNIARVGKVYVEVLESLIKETNKLKKKSIGREWIDRKVLPILEKSKLNPEDKLATSVEYCAFQIAQTLNNNKIKNLLITGGGAHNSYLLERIQVHSECKLIVPDKKTVDFKEALIFAFLGLLRITGDTNCLKSVTGASHDSCAGAVYSS